MCVFSRALMLHNGVFLFLGTLNSQSADLVDIIKVVFLILVDISKLLTKLKCAPAHHLILLILLYFQIAVTIHSESANLVDIAKVLILVDIPKLATQLTLLMF